MSNLTFTNFVAPVLDKCLQTWTTPVLGPLWVSKGEGFSPKGVKEFLSGLLAYTDTKIKEAKHYKEQVNSIIIFQDLLCYFFTADKKLFIVKRQI